MSLRTKIRGFTAWVNLRIMPYNHLLNNVLMDLLTGTNMKYFLESFTGRDLKRLETFDGLTAQQKISRVDWIVDELKSCNVIPEDVKVDSRLFAMRSSDHVFDLIWRLISHDIWFVWERVEFLQHDDIDILTQVPFKWTPEPPPKKKTKQSKRKKSLLTGFGSSSFVADPSASTNEDVEPEEEWIQFPRADFMKNFKKKRRDIGKYPSPDNCILEMINTQLKKTREGRSIYCYTIDDLVDSRVLCALINSFVPNTFTADLLLNDRWTINLVLRTIERMFYIETPFDSEDLVDADPMAVCSYFCFVLMCAYKYRQLKAVINRIDWIKKLMRECNQVLKKLPENSTEKVVQQKKDLVKETGRHKDAIVIMEKRYDVVYGRKWLQHVEDMKLKAHKEIRQKIKDRFDVVTIPRNITINDICLSFVINLSLTNGSGFYLLESKEMLTDGRKVVLYQKNTQEFIDDFTVKAKVPIKKILKLPNVNVVELNPANYPQYDIYVEASSRNKQMKNGTKFVYQVFPGNTLSWQRHFIKCARENDYDTINKMIMFFKGHGSFVNCHEPKSGMTALHWASREGHHDLVMLLLESGANIDNKNNFKCTPLHSAVEGLQRKVCHILIEWGTDVHIKNIRGLTPIESAKNDEFKQYLVDLYGRYSEAVPKIMGGDMKLLQKVIHDHDQGHHSLFSIKSRCINGSTLLHTACYYGDQDIVTELLTKHQLEVGLLDYKGATPLHRAKDTDTMMILLEAEAVVDCEDCEGNTPLHVKSYGESGKPSELASIELLLSKQADQTKRNNKGLLPIHCCAMQGRVDVMALLMKYDTENKVIRTLNEEEDRHPPSLLHLSLANDFIDASYWLMENGFKFKEKEPDILLKRILNEQIKLNDRAIAAKFLMENGADPNPHYPGGNTALHYAASLSGTTDILELILSFGGEVDLVNDEGCSPLFFATQSNNQFAACVLISQGASVKQKNLQGLTAFDYIVDFEEWINSGYFTDDVTARLKAYSLKHARDLIRAITKRVKPLANQPGRSEIGKSTIALKSAASSPLGWCHSQMSQYSIQKQLPMLPPIGQSSAMYLTY